MIFHVFVTSTFINTRLRLLLYIQIETVDESTKMGNYKFGRDREGDKFGKIHARHRLDSLILRSLD